MKKEQLTLKNKIDLITANTSFTNEELFNLPLDVFEKIFFDVNKMRQAIDLVELDIMIYKKNN